MKLEPSSMHDMMYTRRMLTVLAATCTMYSHVFFLSQVATSVHQTSACHKAFMLLRTVLFVARLINY